MTDPWRVLAALLVVALCMLFAVLFTYQRRRIRFLLRNRLTPLTVSRGAPSPIDRWLPWAIAGAVVVVSLAVLALS